MASTRRPTRRRRVAYRWANATAFDATSNAPFSAPDSSVTVASSAMTAIADTNTSVDPTSALQPTQPHLHQPPNPPNLLTIPTKKHYHRTSSYQRHCSTVSPLLAKFFLVQWQWLDVPPSGLLGAIATPFGQGHTFPTCCILVNAIDHQKRQRRYESQPEKGERR